jgi:hypothetical protein
MLTRKWTMPPCAFDNGAFKQGLGFFKGGGGGVEIAVPVTLFFKCVYNSVVEHQSCKLKVLGPIPSGGSCASNQQSYPLCTARLLPAELIALQHLSVPKDTPQSVPALPYPLREDSLAERSKGVAQGDTPRGRGLENQSCHLLCCC